MRELHAPVESRAFSRRLWGRILPKIRPRRIVTLGQDAYRAVLDTMGAPSTTKESPSGWGNVPMGRAQYGGVTVYRLPHLSTFKLFSNPNCRAPLKKLFEE